MRRLNARAFLEASQAFDAGIWESAMSSVHMSSPVHILIDDPLPRVRRITLNRPEKRNALNNLLRKEILDALQAADRDPDISVMILRGAGPCFSAGYDLSADNRQGQPYHTAGGAGQWSRHVVDGWFTIWDLAKPVIAQVHAIALPVAPSLRPPATWCLSRRMPRSAIRRCD